jgi:hypothetical protein
MRGVGIAGVGLLGLPLLWLLAWQPAAAGPKDADRSTTKTDGKQDLKKGGRRKTDQKAEAAAPDGDCDARCLLAEFAGLRGGTKPADIVPVLKRLGYGSLDFVVLLAPDPKDSAFSESFDSYLSAARIAIEAADYSSDRMYDPWHAADATSSDAESKKTEPRTPYREHAGAQLFRREVSAPVDMSVAKRELLLMLVVGESPTWGIQQRAFADALDLVRTVCTTGFCATSGAEPTFTLRILGPSSSGAAESLRAGLTSWVDAEVEADAKVKGAKTNREAIMNPRWTVEITSGSASSRNNQRILQTDLGASLAPIKVEFGATVNPDDVLWNFASEYLQRLGAPPNQIALLVESNTDYGQDFKVEAAKRKGEETDAAKQGGEEKTRDEVLHLPFPLHIAEVRPHSSTERAGAADPVVQPTTIRDLYLSRGSGGPRALSIDGELTRSANERALTNILRTISSEDRRFVGILASDVLDTLFLAQQVRAWFPEVVVVVFTSDLLYLDDAVPFMDGVLVASTYPLADWTQQASFPFAGDRIRHMFQNEYAEGVYNAMLFLLDDKRPEDPSDPRDFTDYGRPFSYPTESENAAPPLWMSVVSRNAFWPLDARDSRTEDLYTQKLVPLASAADPKDLEAAWRLPPEKGLGILSVVFSLVSLLFAYAYCRGLRDGANANAQIHGPGQLLLPSKDFPHPWMHRFGRASLFLTFAIIGFVLLPFVCLEAKLATIGVDLLDQIVKIGTLSLLALAQLVVCGVLVWSALRCLSTEKQEGPAEASDTIVPSVVAVWAVVHSMTWLFDGFVRIGVGKFNPGDDATQLMFLYYRVRVLSGGQSLVALAAMLAVAFLFWICGHLRQVRIHQRAAPLRDWKLLLSEKAEASPLLEKLRIRELSKAAVEQAEKVRPTFAVFSVMALFFLVVVFLVLPRVQFFEKALPFHWAPRFLLVMYVLIVSFLFWGCFSVVSTWVALRRMLLALVAHPIANAFRRIPANLAEVFRHPWSEAVETVWRNHCVVLVNSAKALLPAPASSTGHDPWVELFNGAKALLSATPAPTPSRASTTVPGAPPPMSDLIAPFAAGDVEEFKRFMTSIENHDLAVAQALYSDAPRKPAGISLKPEEFDKLESVSSVHLIRSAVQDDQQLWIRLWEEFLVLRLVAVIGYVRAQIYNVIGTVSVATVPILLVTALYPFQGNRTFLLLVVSLVAAVVATTLTVFTQMNRDRVVSMIEGTAPGSVTWDRSYIMGLILHGAIPLATLISVKFPGAGRALRDAADFVVKVTGH